jgi:hypothetical protein
LCALVASGSTRSLSLLMLRQRGREGILEPLLGAADVSSADGQGSADSVSRLWTAAAGFCTLAGVRAERALFARLLED